jgi:small-conductance mechanosensitive channel
MATPSSAGKESAMHQETLLDAQRQELLVQLDRYTQDGVRRVNWLTTQDDQVCALCTAREQRVLTIAEASKELQGRFCESNALERGCRCALTVVETDFDEMP